MNRMIENTKWFKANFKGGNTFMIPAKIDNPISIPTLRKKGVESIVDWFDQHKQSFYALGWSYLRNQQQMEELFYRSIIKVHKELPRFKKETSFETWVTSIFIHTCRELSEDRSLQALEKSEQHKDLFKALDQLKEYEKEALVLTYVKGFSQEEAAHLLQVSVEKMKEHLFSGIQSLRKEMGHGATFNGCKEYHKGYIDYLERTMERSKKIEFEVHIYHCQACQEDLATFQDVMLNLTERIKDLHVPSGFMENVKDRLGEQERQKQQKNKKRIRVGIVFVSVFALLIGIGFFTGAFSNLYYTWTEEDQELRAFLQQGLGERLNLEEESNGVKIKIKGAIADKVQTLVFYEIEDKKGKNQYVMNYGDGVYVQNQLEIMDSKAHRRDYPPALKSDVNNEKMNIFQGKISLPPLKTSKGTIKLKIAMLQKLILDASKRNNDMTNGEMGYKKGKWNFKIPITKQPSAEYVLHKRTKILGVPIRFDKLTIAPTATILQYSLSNKQSKKRIDNLIFDNIEVNNKKAKFDIYATPFFDSQQDMNWNTLQASFGPLLENKPKEVHVQFKVAYLTIDDPKIIELDASKKYPQTFEYAGSTISIDKVEVGKPAIVVISDHNIKNRKYESLQFQITREGGNETSSEEISTDGVVVDKNGVEYGINTLVPYQKIKNPRYFTTVQTIKLNSNTFGEKVVPKKLEIFGYNTTKYLNDVVKISLK
jgi:RNA polymerase sigma factor (sigma-70 family)